MHLIIDIELSPTHLGGTPLTSFERTILAALHQLFLQGSNTMKTLDEILAQVTAERTVAGSLQTYAGELTEQRDALKTQVAELKAELEAAGQDTAKIDAIAAALDSNDSVLNATAEQLAAAVTATPPAGDDTNAGGSTDNGGDTGAGSTLTGGSGDDTIQTDQGDDTLTGNGGGDPAPEPAPVTDVIFSPTSLTGTVASPISGSFSASDGQAYTYVSDDGVPGITVAGDGFFATAVSQATTGVFNVTPTGPDGVALPPFAVSVSIAADA